MVKKMIKNAKMLKPSTISRLAMRIRSGLPFALLLPRLSFKLGLILAIEPSSLDLILLRAPLLSPPVNFRLRAGYHLHIYSTD
ncbi:hypothetical protein SLE2022_047790 [Rubroshorea leprosula]